MKFKRWVKYFVVIDLTYNFNLVLKRLTKLNTYII